jgi:hypothetical protein
MRERRIGSETGLHYITLVSIFLKAENAQFLWCRRGAWEYNFLYILIRATVYTVFNGSRCFYFGLFTTCAEGKVCVDWWADLHIAPKYNLPRRQNVCTYLLCKMLMTVFMRRAWTFALKCDDLVLRSANNTICKSCEQNRANASAPHWNQLRKPYKWRAHYFLQRAVFAS